MNLLVNLIAACAALLILSQKVKSQDTCSLDGMRQFAAYGCEHFPRRSRSTEHTKYEIEKEEGIRLTRSTKHADRRKIIKRSFFPEGGYLIVKHPYAKKFQYPLSIRELQEFNETNVEILSHDSRKKRNNYSLDDNITYCCHHPTDVRCRTFLCT